MAVASQNTTLMRFLLRMRGALMAADRIVLPVMKMPLCRQRAEASACQATLVLRQGASPGGTDDAEAEAQSNAQVSQRQGGHVGPHLEPIWAAERGAGG